MRSPEPRAVLDQTRAPYFQVLLDYVDFVVHIFHPALRAFYQLERLWGDAEVMPVGAAAVG